MYNKPYIITDNETIDWNEVKEIINKPIKS